MSKSDSKSSCGKAALPGLSSLSRSENKEASKRESEILDICSCPTSIIADDPWSDARTTYLQLVPKKAEILRKTKTQRGTQFRTTSTDNAQLWNTATPVVDRRSKGMLSTFEIAERLLSESSKRGNPKSPSIAIERESQRYQEPLAIKREVDEVRTLSGLFSSFLVGSLLIVLVSSTLALLVAPTQRQQVEERLFSQVLSHISVER